jgi:ketol-acid reductoisomerase
VQMEEMEELSRQIYGGVFADENNLDSDLDKAHFDQEKRKMQPRDVSNVAQDLTDLKLNCRNIGALDVD